MDIGELLTTRQVAELTNIPAATLRWWRHQGGGPTSFTVGNRKVLYRKADVMAYLESKYRADKGGKR